VVLGVYTLESRRRDLHLNALMLTAGAYGLWILLSTYWSVSDGLVLKDLFSFVLAVAYMLSFAVLVRSRRQLRGIFVVLAAGSLVFGLVSFAAYAASGVATRAAGLQGDPNYFAVFQVIALPAALVMTALEQRPGRRLGYYAIVGVIILSVVSSLSRTGLIALSAVVLFTLALPWRVFFRHAGQKLTYAFALLAASAVAVGIGSSALVARVQTILNPNSDANGGYGGSGRLDLWSAAWHGVHEHPWLGLGAGNFQAHALDLLQSTPGVDTAANYVAAGRVVHNAYLETLVELGPVGLALFLLVIALTGRYFVVAFRRARAGGDRALERFSLALLVSLVGYALSAIFLSNELGKPLWILVGLALALDVMAKQVVPLRAVAAPELGVTGEYDLDVREQLVEQREQRIAKDVEALREDRGRLDRRRRTLIQLEYELRERERVLEERVSVLTRRELEAARLHAQLVARERAVAMPEPLPAAPEPAPREPAPPAPPPVEVAPPPPLVAVPEPEPLAPEPVVSEPAPVAAEPELAPVAVLPIVPGQTAWNLLKLEKLEQEAGARFADRREEREFTLLYLREYADFDGVLPDTFDGMLWELYGELLEARR